MPRRPTLTVEKAVNGQWYVKARAANGEPVFWTETYTRKADAERAKKTVVRLMYDLITGLPYALHVRR